MVSRERHVYSILDPGCDVKKVDPLAYAEQPRPSFPTFCNWQSVLLTGSNQAVCGSVINDRRSEGFSHPFQVGALIDNTPPLRFDDERNIDIGLPKLCRELFQRIIMRRDVTPRQPIRVARVLFCCPKVEPGHPFRHLNKAILARQINEPDCCASYGQTMVKRFDPALWRPEDGPVFANIHFIDKDRHSIPAVLNPSIRDWAPLGTALDRIFQDCSCNPSGKRHKSHRPTLRPGFAPNRQDAVTQCITAPPPIIPQGQDRFDSIVQCAIVLRIACAFSDIEQRFERMTKRPSS